MQYSDLSGLISLLYNAFTLMLYLYHLLMLCNTVQSCATIWKLALIGTPGTTPFLTPYEKAHQTTRADLHDGISTDGQTVERLLHTVLVQSYPHKYVNKKINPGLQIYSIKSCNVNNIL